MRLAGLWLGLVLLAGAGLAGAQDVRDSLAGQLLVATESIGDPRFHQTVIYMVEHDAGGAMGLVVNMPLGDVSLSEILERLDPDGSGEARGTIPVYYGGPVEPGSGFFLHSSEYLPEGSIVVADDVAMTAHPEILRDIARGEGPKRALFALGYAGWGPGQLESELARDAWFVVPADPSLVFAEDPRQSWPRAAALRGVEL